MEESLNLYLDNETVSGMHFRNVFQYISMHLKQFWLVQLMLINFNY